MAAIFQYNGLEIPFDIEDYEDLERFDKAQKFINETEDKVDNETDLIQRIKKGCEMYKECFSIIFGSSVAEKLVEKPTSVASWEYAFIAFVEYVQKSSEEATKRRSSMSKFSNAKRDKRRGLNA